MTKDRQLLKGVSKNQPQTHPQDQNKPKNIFKEQIKKDPITKALHQPGLGPIGLKPTSKPKQCKEPQPKPIHPTPSIQQLPLTSYRPNTSPEDIQGRKWQCLTKFHQMSSKAHYIYTLKFATLFLSYSLAEKTISLVLDDKITFDYWAACCLFMPMKYEEIYPPRLRDLQGIIKAAIDLKLYWNAEIAIWQSIGQDLNFVSLNTRLSEYLHTINKKERFFVFYLLQTALYKRNILKKFTDKELVISVMYALTSHKLTLETKHFIDGVSVERIQQCTRKIVLSQIQGQQSNNFIFKKYQMEVRECVALKGTPNLDGLRNLLVSKVNQPEKPSRIIGFCLGYKESEMVDEEDEIKAKQVVKKRAVALNFYKPRF